MKKFFEEGFKELKKDIEKSGYIDGNNFEESAAYKIGLRKVINQLKNLENIEEKFFEYVSEKLSNEYKNFNLNENLAYISNKTLDKYINSEDFFINSDFLIEEGKELELKNELKKKYPEYAELLYTGEKDLFEKLNIIVEKISENAYFNNNNLKIKNRKNDTIYNINNKKDIIIFSKAINPLNISSNKEISYEDFLEFTKKAQEKTGKAVGFINETCFLSTKYRNEIIPPFLPQKEIECFKKFINLNGRNTIKNTTFEGYQINYNHKEKQLYFGDKIKGEGIKILPNKIEKLKKAKKIFKNINKNKIKEFIKIIYPNQCEKIIKNFDEVFENKKIENKKIR